jgi:two-component system response regulator
MQNFRSPFTVVLADDDEDDRLLAKDAMEAADSDYSCHTVCDGQELLDFLRQTGKYKGAEINSLPSVILLDLNMPILDGRETLRLLKEDPDLSSIPVVILSTSANSDDIEQSYKLGASSYMVKPTQFNTLVDMMKTFNNYWFECAAIPKSER